VRRRPVLAALAALSLIAAAPLAAAAAPAHPDHPDHPGAAHATTSERVCADPAPGDAACDARVVTDASGAPAATATPRGLGPLDIQGAYHLPPTGGSGRVVAIVDAYDDPTAENDLATYRSTYGLPPCTTASGCFRKVNQNGGSNSLPRSNAGWAQEISLDLDMVSATCPGCGILLVEAKSASFSDLSTAVRTAATFPGVVAISNSYGGSESTGYASSYNQPGKWVTASSGDSGYGVQSPASYPTVIAVGGTSLTVDSTHTRTSETAWSGAGSGCSAYVAKPTYQTDSGCARRTVTDVSAVADPATGVAVYDSTPYQGSSGWLVFGGTSASSPIVASVHALAGSTSSTAASLYSSTASVYDVTSGSNGTCSPTYLCTARAGYDGPTGVGAVNGTAGF